MRTGAFLSAVEPVKLLMLLALLICGGCGERSVQLHVYIEDAPVQAGVLIVVPLDASRKSEVCDVSAGACELRGSWTGSYSCTLNASFAEDIFPTTSSSEVDAAQPEEAPRSTELPLAVDRVRSHAMQVDFREGVREYDLRFTAAHALEHSD
jgi:hypothetical protein